MISRGTICKKYITFVSEKCHLAAKHCAAHAKLLIRNTDEPMKKILVTIVLLACLLPLSAQIITQKDKDRAARLTSQMTLQEKLEYIGGYNSFYIRAVPRLGIPEIRMADGPQGVRNDTKSTMFACGIDAAATWNRELARRMGEGLGQDCRARGVHILLGPGVNIYRSPLCGRNFEYYGEDPFLASETAVAYIEGVQSRGVMATIKHFAGNNQEWNRHQISSDIDERTMQEIYLPTFRKAVTKANVGAIMSSYNLINCVHATENKELIQDIMRGQWGFEGIFMSDWNATYSAVAAANAGLDLEMPSGKFMNPDNLENAVLTGIVPQRTIDIKVEHILQTLSAFGFLDRPQLDESIGLQNDFSDRTALQMAREGAVLVENHDSFLPIKKGRVLVLGPNSGNIPTGGGSGFVNPFTTVSVGEGMTMMGRKFDVTVLNPVTVSADISTTGEFFTDATLAQNGLTGHYFSNISFDGEPVFSRVDTTVDFNWKKAAPDERLPVDKFAIRWCGVMVPSEDKTVQFTVSGDDGYRLFVDNREVLGHWRNHSRSTREMRMPVEKGRKYDIRLEYYDNASDASISLSYGKVDWQGIDAAAAKSTAVIYCAGFNSTTEREDADRSFALPQEQIEAIKHLRAVRDNVVVVINSGGGVDFSTWSDDAKAILMAWYPGQVGGQAVAEIITGKISPSGRLPISIERRLEDNPTFKNYYINVDSMMRPVTRQHRVCYNEGVFVGYRGYSRTGIKPLYPFGYGLSYSTFDYSNLAIEQSEGRVMVRFDVTNTGAMDAADVAQIYVGDIQSSVERPARELKGYEKVFLKKGETRHVEITLDSEAFQFWDVATHKFVVEAGEFVIEVGRSSDEIKLSGKVDLVPEFFETSRAARIVAQIHNPRSRQVLVASHRGDWRNYPENSIPAIESAIRMGVDIVEIDTRMTADSVLVIMHDATIDRTTDGKGKVSELSAEYITSRKLRAGQGVATQWTVPTLEDVLKVCRGRIVINIDKGYDYYDQAMELLRRYNMVEQVLIKGKKSPDTVAAKFASHESNMMYMPIIDINNERGRTLFEQYVAGQAQLAYEVCWSTPAPEVEACMKRVIDSGSKLWINSLWDSLCGGTEAGLSDDSALLDIDKAYGRLIEMGATMIQTDRPQMLIEYLRSKGLHD